VTVEELQDENGKQLPDSVTRCVEDVQVEFSC
jgi:hypothetical protein